jgi:hypothetical protein
MDMKKSTKKSKASKPSSKGLSGANVAASVVNILSSPVTKWLVLGTGVVVAYKIIKGQAKEIIEQEKKDNVADVYGDDTVEGLAAQYATQLYQAIAGLGTDETMVYNTANGMYRNGVSFEKVNKNYKNLYNANLIEDLQGDLNSTEMAKFNSILRGQALYGLGSVDNLL